MFSVKNYKSSVETSNNLHSNNCKPPVGLTLDELQRKIFGEDKKGMENHSYRVVNNLEKLWYVYCINTHKHHLDISNDDDKK